MRRVVIIAVVAWGALLLGQEGGDSESFGERLARAALKRLEAKVRYDPSYVVIAYPGGDVPADTGVCSDLIVRAYRQLGIDLQVWVHRDMKANFSRYPKRWGLSGTDRNIDHRRVPNLQCFFTRQGSALPITREPEDYLPGDVVAWDLNGQGLTHMGIVVAGPEGCERPWVIHNIGLGPRKEDVLFSWTVIGHYRWSGQ